MRGGRKRGRPARWAAVMGTAQELREIEEALRRAGAGEAVSPPDRSASAAAHPRPKARPEPVAIVGLSGFFPQCSSVAAFWRALDRDRPLIEEIPATRFDWRAIPDGHGRRGRPSGCRWGGFIPDIAGFDPEFFGLAPGEAAVMDPRERLLLMSAYQTLADAGYTPRALKGSRTGVFVAVQDSEYVDHLKAVGRYTGEAYAQGCVAANRISYVLDFHGASEIVDAQCPGAAVALHRAVTALRGGEVDHALVGAANLLIRPEPFALLGASGQLSPTDSVAAFGSGAQGHLRADGVASVLLKPLRAALADGDHVYAILRNTAVNYSGQGSASMAAPNGARQAELIAHCYREAGIDPRDVGTIEAQGMGNVLADLAKWQACNRALLALADEQGVALEAGQCRISTLKPMAGHMESASALGALFKIVRSLHTATVHKVLGFTDYHPELAREGQPCAIAAETQAWPRSNGPRLAGLNAYSMSGVNAHVLIEEFIGTDEAGGRVRGEAYAGRRQRRGKRDETAEVLVPLSAKSPAALWAMARQLAAFLAEESESDPAETALRVLSRLRPVRLADLAFTLQAGREELAHLSLIHI